MASLRAMWEKWCARFMAMSQRERLMISVAVIVGIVMLGSTTFVEPARAKAKLLRSSVDKKKTEVRNLDAQLMAVQQQLQQDPDVTIKAELEALRTKLRQAGEDLAKANDTLVPPSEMNGMLERILARQTGLQLVSLRTLPPGSFVERKPEATKPAGEVKSAENEQEFDIYRHGVEVKLTGTYAHLYTYLSQLEQEQKKLLWGEVRLKVLEHPKAEMTLVVYTLSVDKAWLSL